MTEVLTGLAPDAPAGTARVPKIAQIFTIGCSTIYGYISLKAAK
ncbi:hypothetical protein ACWCXK_32785 [Streptomyces sp. NPDC001739]